jgi:Domain of unknown function (DUF4390)
MMDFFMHYYKNKMNKIRLSCLSYVNYLNSLNILSLSTFYLVLNFTIALLLYSASSYAIERNLDDYYRYNYADIKKLELETFGDSVYASLDIELNIENELRNAIHKGLPISFVLKCDITSKRWYWFDRKIANHEYKWLITYRPFMHKYKLTTKNGNFLYMDTLDEVLRYMRFIRKWAIFDKVEAMKQSGGSEYDVAVRLYLDSERLPKVMQINATTNKMIQIDSGWREYIVSLN